MSDLDQFEPGIYGLEAETGLGESSLADVVSRLLDTGVVLKADLTLTLADVDLVFVGLNAVICSPDRMRAQLQQAD
ncbi:MAG: gas vesicle protein [Pseudomonadota bacterium]